MEPWIVFHYCCFKLGTMLFVVVVLPYSSHTGTIDCLINCLTGHREGVLRRVALDWLIRYYGKSNKGDSCTLGRKGLGREMYDCLGGIGGDKSEKEGLS